MTHFSATKANKMIIDQTKQTNTLTLMHALGWQGGTIHDLATEIGLNVDQILNLHTYSPRYTGLDGDNSAGWFATRTCSVQWFKVVIKPRYIGNIEFWHGVLEGRYSKEILTIRLEK